MALKFQISRKSLIVRFLMNPWGRAFLAAFTISATLGVGARGALNLVPSALEGVYGSRTPAGLAIFLRVRPALLEGAHAMDPEMHHGDMSGHDMEPESPASPE